MKIYYVTYHDTISGVYESQVVDVIRMLRVEGGLDISLIAFLSIRSYCRLRKKIKSMESSSIVIPSFPFQRFWFVNVVFAFIHGAWARSRRDHLVYICRGVFATNIFLPLRGSSTVIYDGRGAVYAETKEYSQADNIYRHLKLVDGLERSAIFLSHKQLAVSYRLVEYWRDRYEFDRQTWSVIPCSLTSNNSSLLPSETVRRELGLKGSDIVFVYSGSTAAWQSFDLLYSVCDQILRQLSAAKIIFLTKRNEVIRKLCANYAGRVIRKWVGHHEVHSYLSIADYGLLIRSDSVTNKVSAPVKFAEYLSAGLPVIITDTVGDFSNDVRRFDLGVVVNQELHDFSGLGKTSKKDRDRLVRFCSANYDKTSGKILQAYLELLG